MNKDLINLLTVAELLAEKEGVTIMQALSAMQEAAAQLGNEMVIKMIGEIKLILMETE